MGEHRVLIVEDDPLVSAHLEAIISQTIEADVVVGASIVEAFAALAWPIDFAFLDVDVLDGTTYGFASKLSSVGVPFAFVSASNRDGVPDALKNAPFVSKPYTKGDIIGVLKESGQMS
jgi:DNA-binding NarL/FixJ family response regulator